MGFFCFCLGMLLMDDQRVCLHVCMHLGDGFRVQGMGLGFRGWACTKVLSLHKQAILAEEKRRGGEAFCFAWSDGSLMGFLLLSLHAGAGL